MAKIALGTWASCSQVGIAWAIAKGTLPIIRVTKERHGIEAAEAAKIQLTAEEVARLEALADATGIDTRTRLGTFDGVSFSHYIYTFSAKPQQVSRIFCTFATREQYNIQNAWVRYSSFRAS